MYVCDRPFDVRSLQLETIGTTTIHQSDVAPGNGDVMVEGFGEADVPNAKRKTKPISCTTTSGRPVAPLTLAWIFVRDRFQKSTTFAQVVCAYR
jgi:hypothetical protein